MTKKKRKVHVYVPVVGMKYLGEFEVDADATRDEIIEMAFEKGDDPEVDLCHQCSRGVIDGVRFDDSDWSGITVEDENE